VESFSLGFFGAPKNNNYRKTLMIITTSKIKIPHKIRQLIKKNDFGMFILSTRQFNFLLRKWGHEKEVIGLAMLDEGLIFINGGRLEKEQFSQGQINAILLHEISHILLNSRSETKVDNYVERLARKCRIDIEDV